MLTLMLLDQKLTCLQYTVFTCILDSSVLEDLLLKNTYIYIYIFTIALQLKQLNSLSAAFHVFRVLRGEQRTSPENKILSGVA